MTAHLSVKAIDDTIGDATELPGLASAFGLFHIPWPTKPPWLGVRRITREVGRCSGHCCQAFTLPLTPEYVDELKSAAEGAERGEPWPSHLRRYTDDDIAIVARMVRPLGRFPILTPAGHRFRSPLEWYACEHHDSESGDCKIYETRPRMCRDHPYGNTCNYVDCTRREEVDVIELVGPPNVHETFSDSESWPLGGDE